MELKIFIVLFCTLFNGGHSLQCYECSGKMGACKSKVCPGTAKCASATIVQITGGTEVKMESKGCKVKESCISGSVNLGVTRKVTFTQCCNTDLCNSKDAPVYSTKSPNGKQCYNCNGKSCFNKLKCLGDEDYCFTAKATDQSLSKTMKGCVSKSICGSASQATQGFKDFSCCKGNLCNSAKSVTQNLLFLLWPFFFYILIH